MRGGGVVATIGLDTSVVVRLLVGEPADQAQTARRRLEQAFEVGDTVLVCDLVVAEAYYALQHHYGVPKTEALELLNRLLRSGVVSPEPPASLHAFDSFEGAGLVDRLIHERYRDLGAGTLTFDERQARLEGAVQLEG